MDLVSRLKQYLASQGITITQFADECDIPRPTASQLLAGRNKKVSDEIIGKIHYTYPTLSVTWLMFGEGDMLTKSYSATSEPETAPSATDFQPQTPDRQNVATDTDNIFSISNSDAEKSEPLSQHPDIQTPATNSSDEFSFQNKNTFAFTPSAPKPQNDAPTPKPHPITLTPDKGKCVTGIVVYYSDSTYESFVPDPEGKHPFMR